MNKMKKIGMFFIVLIIFSILLSQLVFSLGIRPAKTEINSNEFNTYSGSFWVVNNDYLESELKIYVTGEMADYINLNVDKLTFRDDHDALEIQFNVSLPEEVPPGQSVAVIIVEEELGANIGSTIASKLVLKHKVYIIGEYPDKYVKTKLNFHEMEDDFEIVAEVENLGKKEISDIKTTFYVNDQKQTLETLETVSESLAKKENKLLTAKISKNQLENGEFEVLAKVEFDGQVQEVVKNLIYGEPEIEVSYFNDYFIMGAINPYTLELLNKWNQKIENVFVDVVVKKVLANESYEKVADFRTVPTEISAFQREVISGYFDTTERDEGNYVFSMVVNFWNIYKMSQKDFEVSVINKEEDLGGVSSFTGASLAENEENKNLSKDRSYVKIFAIIFIVLFGIIINTFVVLLITKRKRNDGWE
jgi:hypothetical protein